MVKIWVLEPVCLGSDSHCASFLVGETLSRLNNFSTPQFPLLCSGDDHSPYLREVD